MHKKECEGRYALDDKECEQCPYHYKCEFEQEAWDEVIYGGFIEHWLRGVKYEL